MPASPWPARERTRLGAHAFRGVISMLLAVNFARKGVRADVLRRIDDVRRNPKGVIWSMDQ
jgi:hypothetical protein